MDRLNRREFLGGAAALLAAPPPRPLTVGLIADPHHGLAPDAQARLEAFLGAASDRAPDFLLQLGDFCHPPRAVKSAAAFLDTFASFRGPRYHVLGNHDLDLARSKREILDAWGVKQAFYSFDRGGFHFAVLDCNSVREPGGRFADWRPGRRYEGWVHPEQIDWLKADLAKTSLPAVVVSHQGIGPKDKGGVVPNGGEVRKVIRESGRVVLCLHGHNHVDAAPVVDGIPHLQLNSASYLWVGEEYGRMAPYQDSLYAFLTLDPEGTIRLKGRASAFRRPTPAERKYPLAGEVTAAIADREFRFRAG